MDFFKLVIDKSCPAIVEGLDKSSTREILDVLKEETAFGLRTHIIVRDLEETLTNKTTSTCLRRMCNTCGEKPDYYSKLKAVLAQKGHTGLLEIMENNETAIRDICKDVLYRLSDTGISKHNIRIPTDANKCYIDGLCQMPNGEIIVSDAANQTIKRLDASYKVLDNYDVPDRPNSICTISEKEIVVAMETKGLQFMSVGRQIKKTKSIALGHDSFGVAYFDGQLFVSDKKTKIYVHAMSGDLLRVIQHDESGSEIFSGTRQLAVSANGETLYVADRENGLVVLKTDGTLLNIVRAPEIQGARGVFLDICGNVFVVCCLTHSVVQIDSTGGRVLGVVADKTHGLYYPGAALVDANKSSLVVTSSPTQGGNYLDVRQLGHS